MRSRLDSRYRWLLIVAGALLALAIFDIWWVAEYRHGYPFDVDEAGYTSIALVDHFGLQNGGLQGWWEAFQNQTPNAPLVPFLTSVVMVVKPGVLEGFGVLIGFMVVLGLAVYAIGERLAGPRLGALAGIVAAAAPGTFTFAREYIFALPTAALLAVAVYGLMRSEGLRRRWWIVLCGVAIGLMLMARTMAVGFVPGIGLAAVITVLAQRPDRKRLLEAAGNLVLLGVVSAAVAAIWYVKNFQPVYDYLTGYGYGNKSNEFGSEYSWLSWDKWHAEWTRMLATDILVPLGGIILIGLAALLVAAGRRVAGGEDKRAALLSLLASDAFAIGVVFACGYVVLASSSNAGNGFTYPLAMLLIPLATMTLRFYRVAVVPAVAVLALITALNVAAATDLWEGVSRKRDVDVPTLGALPWVSGVPNAVSAIRQQLPGPEAEFTESEKGWPEADHALAAYLMEREAPVTAFASRNRVISSNSVTLASLLDFHRSIPFAQLNPEPTDSVATYVEQLTDPQYGLPQVLIAMSTAAGDFEPVVTQAKAEAAARKVGFRRVAKMPLPDRQMRIWEKPPEAEASGG